MLKAHRKYYQIFVRSANGEDLNNSEISGRINPLLAKLQDWGYREIILRLFD